MRVIGPVGMMRKAGGGHDAPIVSMEAANFYFGTFFGYILAGGPTSVGFRGTSGGTLSASLLPGETIDSLIYVPQNDTIGLSVVGDATAALADITGLMIGSTFCAIIEPPGYDPDFDTSGISFIPAVGFTDGTTYSLQLVYG